MPVSLFLSPRVLCASSVVFLLIEMKNAASSSLIGTFYSSKTMAPSSHFFSNAFSISTKNQIILLLELMQTLVSITLKSEGRHQRNPYLLHNLSLRPHSRSIRVVRFSSPIATQLCPATLDHRERTEHG